MAENGKRKVGITGQPGFVGTHLYNRLGTLPEEFERVPCRDEFFSDEAALRGFVKSCDAIVHLAAMNRHPDPQVIYDTNVRLVQQLIGAMEAEKVTPHVLLSSSTQEERNNPYGNSKKEGRRLLQEWADRTGGRFTGCVIPNVFGPYGRPNYNSVTATFCHKLTHGETPEIQADSSIRLIYVEDLCSEFIRLIREGKTVNPYPVPHGAEKKVSELLVTLERFRKLYFEQGIIPELKDTFEVQLFNTFCGYIDHRTFFPFPLKKNTDARGTFVETVKLDHIGGQVSFSTTAPGVTRGNHYHTRKIERFAVIKGKARIELRKIGTDDKMVFELDGENPSFVDMPVWHTHNLTNSGNEELYTIFWINEFYDPSDPDTFFEKV
ncbi:MAG: GDP-6-deoxy-D-mannose reductase [Lentisphaerae bacterium ADurb.Bin242]|nr:MAG: GDP-6-deoxy-D-mannose reductase [Lentisphaerae bacterium ADurb.Bin242]